MSIYQDLILEHYRHPRNFRVVPRATRSVTAVNSVCGDKMHLQIREEDGKVVDIGFTGEGCAIFMASSSLLTEYAKGKKVKKLITLAPQNIIQLINIPLSPNRLKCALLPLEALHDALSISK